MKTKFSFRWIYGIGLIFAAICFFVPVVSILTQNLTGFDLIKLYTNSNQYAKAGLSDSAYITGIVLIVLFSSAVVGGIFAFVPKMKGMDIFTFVLILASVIYLIVKLAGMDAGSQLGNDIVNALFHKEAGFYLICAGLALGTIGFIISLTQKQKKSGKKK